ncbi:MULTISPECIES: hypothetical protein [unclassified Gordonia (in: high G+C Gram-positive bacteria)]|uniref:hypothetical protein n=1 Tax=unclassified Gordonia (in: high G+C Gram-positive bacteria) TaxID=2657482 RepID=UPI001CF99B53|nr:MULTISPECIES: hypothetical protein [unclassified Gordonia (in: high G+C Gram-positive bacteria)]MCT1353835.1 hypothetical protein [Gordonia sp. p3-SID1431]UCZ91263.1 hypothetical protein LEL84_06285 [Gordonia sp. WA4-43]
MTAFPAVEDALFTVFERRASHHHENTGETLPDTTFQLSVNVQPEKLGIRIRIVDEYRDGTASVDVAVLYYWERDVTPEDDLNGFVEETALPQVLSCASATLIDTARSITSDEVPFYGLSGLEGIRKSFRNRKKGLKEILAESNARRESEDLDADGEGAVDNDK